MQEAIIEKDQIMTKPWKIAIFLAVVISGIITVISFGKLIWYASIFF